MNPDRLRAALLALLYVLGLTAPQVARAAGNDPLPYYSTTAQLIRWNSAGRIRPPAILPSAGDSVAQGWRLAVRGAVEATPPETIWSAMRAGGTRILPGALRLGAAGGRALAYGGVGQLGAIVVNAGFQAFYNEVKKEAGGTDNPLRQCADYNASDPSKFGLDMSCGTVYSNGGPPVWPRGSKEQGFHSWWNVKGPGGSTYYMNVTGKGKDGLGRSIFDVDFDCPYMPYGNYKENIQDSELEQIYSNYVNGCNYSTQQAQPIPLTTYVEGQTDPYVAPHPEVKQQLKNIIINYIDKTPPTLDGTASIYPGIDLSPLPTVNEAYGTPVDPDIDTDGDGWSDAEEVLRGSDPNDAKSVPDLTRDTDGDGVADGIEDKLGTDPYDAKDKPSDEAAQVEKDKAKCTAGGGSWNDSDNSCRPPKDEPACKDGFTYDVQSKQCVENPNKDKTPVDDNCGEFSVSRLLSHTGHYLRDVVFPCQQPKELLEPLITAASTKYPFAMLKNVNGNLISVGSGGQRSAVLPDKFGPFTLDWSWLAPLLVVAGLLFKGFCTWLALDLVLGKLWGQVVVK